MNDEGSDGSGKAVCSVTGCPCKCGPGDQCQAGKPKLDKVSDENIRSLKTARLYLEAVKDRLDEVQEEHIRARRFPGPEVREIRRKVVTAQAMIDEVIA